MILEELGSGWLSPLDEAFVRLLDAERSVIVALAVAVMCLIATWKSAKRIRMHRIAKALRGVGGAEVTSMQSFEQGATATVEFAGADGPFRADARLAGTSRRHLTFRVMYDDRQDNAVENNAPLAALRPGVPVHVTFSQAGAQLKFSSHVADLRVGPLGLEMFLPRPRTMIRVQRRENFRVTVATAAVLRLHGAPAGAPFVRGNVDSLSAGGFRIVLTGALESGAVVEAVFPALECGIGRMMARVVEVTHHGAPESGRFLARCEYIHIDETTRDRLINCCFGLQIADRRMRYLQADEPVKE